MSSEALLNSSLPHDFVMGGISRGGSQQYIIKNAGLDEAQAGIKIAGRNINLRYADEK